MKNQKTQGGVPSLVKLVNSNSNNDDGEPKDGVVIIEPNYEHSSNDDIMAALGQCNGDNVINNLKAEIESLKNKLTSTNERILSFCNKTDELNKMKKQQAILGDYLFQCKVVVV